MRKFIAQKRFILLLSVIALGVLLLLSAGLDNLQFNDGNSLGWARAEVPQSFANDLVRQFTEVSLWKQGAFWALTLVLVVLVASLMSPEMRKRFVRAILSLLLTLFALSYLLENNLIRIPEIEPAVSGEQGDGSQEMEDLPPVPEFYPPEVPAWASFLISLGVVLVFLGLTWALLRWWRQFNYHPPPKALKDLASIARSSLRDLSTGSDWADTVTNCYVRMSEVVGNKRGLVRQVAMTPTEFAWRLERAGLPGDAVQRLTHLFESVRYGAHKPARNEINEAVSCLNAILHYCGEQA